MKTKPGLVLVLMVAVLVLTACTPSASANSCPIPTTVTKLLTNAEDGYCLLYPAEYSTSVPHYIIVNPISAPGDVPGDAWVSIYTESAEGRTADQVAMEEIEAVGPGFNITSNEVPVEGETAIVIDGLPGQDSNRKVLIVHNDRLYTFIFEPWYPGSQGAEQSTPLEGLFEMIMDSIHFLPDK